MSLPIKVLLGLMLALLAGCRTIPEEKLVRHEFARVEMGMQFRITLYAADAGRARLAAKTALDRIRGLNAILSDYEDDSELNHLRATAGSGDWVRVSDELWTVLRRADELSKQTGGAFDVTAGPVIQLWKRARRQRALPDAEALAEARTRTGHGHLEFRPSDQAVTLRRAGMRLDLGGIAKGYALDEALRTLRAHGIHRALVTGGGDMVAGDAPPGESGWRIALDDPSPADEGHVPMLLLCRAGFATSGDRFQFVELNGTRYSHIIDPRTGVGLTNRSTVNVVAADGLAADSLATAISVLGSDEGLALARRWNAECRVVRPVPGAIEEIQTAGFAKQRLTANTRSSRPTR